MIKYLKTVVTLLVFFLCIHGVLSKKNNRPPDPTKIRVVSIEVSPYLMKTVGPNGRVEYRGYVKDLLDFLMADLDVRYDLYMVPDGEYGYLQDGKTWNGMIKELMDNNADLAAAPLHRTPTRAREVDFTSSILNISATMLMKKPEHGMDPEIHSVKDLENHHHISVGTLRTGTIRRSFVTTENPSYINLWNRIENTRPTTFTSSNAEGIHRVRTSDGNYVYIMPSDIAEYNAGEMPCNLLTVGEFFHRNLAFAVQKTGSDLLPRINKAISRLENSGYFEKLYSRWWLQNRPCNSFTYAGYVQHLSNTKTNLSVSISLIILGFIMTYIGTNRILF